MKGERVAQLELLLRSHPEGLRRAEIARRLGVHRSTISRYVEDLSQHIDIYEENNLIKIRPKEDDDSIALSVYESLAFNMSAEALASDTAIQSPHLASGLRKIAMNMRTYAPKVSENILAVAERIDQNVQRDKSLSSHFSKILEVLIDAWVTGRMVRLGTDDEDGEIELAPYFIGFRDEDGEGRKPITVTGRLRHTKDIVTLDITKITQATLLEETYTIPDNLKPFRMSQKEETDYDAIDMIPLVLSVREKSAMNSFSSLVHTPFSFTHEEDGRLMWMNDQFREILGSKLKGEAVLSRYIPELNRSIFPREEDQIVEMEVYYHDKEYRAELRRVSVRGFSETEQLLQMPEEKE